MSNRNVNLYPAQEELEARRKREEIELCGKNRGPHDYVPIEWITSENIQRVSRFLCRTCFNTINTSTLIATYRDISHV